MADDRLPDIESPSGLEGESRRPVALLGDAGGVGTRPAGEDTSVLRLFSGSPPSSASAFSWAVSFLRALSVKRRR